MKHHTMSVLLFFLLLIPNFISPVIAQVQPGLGVSVGSNTGVLLPILLQKWRIEPLLTFSYSASSPEHPIDSNFSYGYKSTSIRGGLSVGLFYRTLPSKDFEVYYGPRLGLALTHSTYDYMTITPGYSYASTTNSHTFTGALAIGAEYRFSEHFSLGAEAFASYSSTPAPYYTQTPTKSSNSNPSVTQSGNVGSSAIARIYW